MTVWQDRGLVEDILARSIDDWVYPAQIVAIARRSGVADEEALRALAIGLVTEVVVGGLMIPGDVTESGFRMWDCTPAGALERIVAEWLAWGSSELTPGAIVWLAPTDSGERIGRAVLRREGSE